MNRRAPSIGADLPPVQRVGLQVAEILVQAHGDVGMATSNNPRLMAEAVRKPPMKNFGFVSPRRFGL